ncbi:5-(carboxyamino)imidazole ribonucleotide synthase [bacterium]|nr:5-(carboxyamino)imidazole ribonucleotide synthase [bacterium]NUN46242.1 5-(carboxyamino)imidazole ribonucleotide synthase [bacterium]
MIKPGSTLGMLGGGQLGRMFTMAAHAMGYRVIVLDPDPQSPAGHIADRHLTADYHEAEALHILRTECSAITTEFENVPADTLEILSHHCFIRPSAKAVSVTQDRLHEKSFLRIHQIPTNKFAAIRTESDIDEAVHFVGLPAILKRNRYGYDGKGQYRVRTIQDVRDAFRAMHDAPCILEEMLNFEKEVSVVLARAVDGSITEYPTGENIHENGILDMTIVPARITEATDTQARTIARQVAEKLDYHGVLAVEMFVMPDGRVLVNEMAPRPHNSAHYTLDACITDQFEQQVRVLCGLPAGDPTLLTPVVMVNLLGDLWGSQQPHWEKLFSHTHVKLHLYGKSEARPGRKMGHFNILDRNIENAIALGRQLKKDIAYETR